MQLLSRKTPPSALREFLDSSAAGGLVLMAAAAAALIVANSPVSRVYFDALHAYLGPLSTQHWINDGLMAVFFLLVGLEIKREMLDGQLATWSRRVLPGVCALGGMAVPALVFLAFNWQSPQNVRGWAIPSATDIAFALGVLSLLGNRIPSSLKVFLTALAIIDDLGAVLIIAIFYTGDLSFLDLGLAAVATASLAALNRAGVLRLAPYLAIGAVLWFFTLRSGIHATIAGVVLAMTIPLRGTPGHLDAPAGSPLHRLEHAIQKPVTFFILPIFGFANAGVSFAGLGPDALVDPLTLGVALGLVLGKLVGIFGTAWLLIRFDWVDMPMGAGWGQLVGVALLGGIGFTMSLFIGLLAFANDSTLQDDVKIGILVGSLVAGLLGWAVLRVAPREIPFPPKRTGQR